MDKNILEIRDMYLIAALVAYGARIESIDKSDIRRQIFHLNVILPCVWIMDSGEVKRIDKPTTDYFMMCWAAKVLFLPPSYPDQLRSIRSAIFG